MNSNNSSKIYYWVIHSSVTLGRIFRVGFVNENFPLLFSSYGGKQKGILNDIYTSFAQLNGFDLEWILVDEYGYLFYQLYRFIDYLKDLNNWMDRIMDY